MRVIEAAPAAPRFASQTEARAWLRKLAATEEGVNDASLLRLAAREAHPDHNGGKRDLWDQYESARRLLKDGDT